MKSWKKPTHETVDKAIASLGRRETYRYFFQQLNNPEWITPLKDRGFFSSPPDIVKNDEQGTTSFPPWPESRYLSRMASERPELVADTIIKMADTENAYVLEDLISAAAEMPADISKLLLDKVVAWIDAPYHILFTDNAGKLINKLAEGDEIEAALLIAHKLLEVLPPKSGEIDLGEDVPFRIPPKPTLKFEYFEEILNKHCSILLDKSGIKHLEFLCNQLNQCLYYSCLKGESSPPQDYSTIWRPVIEDLDKRRPSEPKKIFVSGVRDASEYLIKNRKANIRNIKNIFSQFKWYVYDRIFLHLLILFHEQMPEEVISTILDPEYFNNDNLQREYSLLLEDGFSLLDKGQKEVVLDWINQGPDVEAFKQSRKAWTGSDVHPEDIGQFVKHWKLVRLNWVSDYLPEGLRESYSKLVTEFGVPKSPHEITSGASFGGPFSPLSTDELESMSIPDIVQYLKEWTPPEDRSEPSPEGLGRSLRICVEKRVEHFASEANLFIGLDPTYIRSLLMGLKSAKKQEIPFDWTPTLTLCEWVLGQPREIPDRNTKSFMDKDPDWGWTRKSIADLFSIGFEDWPGMFILSKRTAVWSILEKLSEDPDPTPEDEAIYGGSNMDPATYSINTTRGETFHSIVNYALWVHRNLNSSGDSSSGTPPSFKDMPEVKSLLEKHLDIEIDPSLAIRSIYGRWFPV